MTTPPEPTTIDDELAAHSKAQMVRPFSLSFDGIRETVQLLSKEDGFEGLVWHHPDGRMAKIKARDFPKAGA